MPCIILTAVIINAETEKNAAAQQTENTAIPVINIFLLSVISAIRPKGTENAATDSVYPVISHPTASALTLNSAPISGMERLSALPVNVVINAVMTATANTGLCISLLIRLLYTES